ncbi:Uncharacterised protein [Enterobacter cloacae]|nr:Uncharacterised protein [Enterobacter cloacae]
MRFVQYQIEGQIRVFDGVLDGIPQRISLCIRGCFEKPAFIIEPAHQQAFFAKLLRVEEIDFSSLKLTSTEGVFHYHHIVVVDTVTGLHQAKTGLLVQCRIVTKPNHYRAGVGIEIKFVVAMK